MDLAEQEAVIEPPLVVHQRRHEWNCAPWSRVSYFGRCSAGGRKSETEEETPGSEIAAYIAGQTTRLSVSSERVCTCDVVVL